MQGLKMAIVAASGLSTALGSHWVPAAGFALLEQSAKRMGSAYAGGGVMADDAAEVWYNPAVSTLLDRESNLGLHYVEPSFRFANRTGPTAGNAPLLNNSRLRDDGGTGALVPNLAHSAPLGGPWYTGVTLNVPFGLATDYQGDWVGRYQALDSDITSINLNPFAAYRISDDWSAGFGINFNYTEVSLSRALDFAAICAQALGAQGLGTECPNGALPGSGDFDGEVEADGDDLGYGYNAALLWTPTQKPGSASPTAPKSTWIWRVEAISIRPPRWAGWRPWARRWGAAWRPRFGTVIPAPTCACPIPFPWPCTSA